MFCKWNSHAVAVQELEASSLYFPEFFVKFQIINWIGTSKCFWATHSVILLPSNLEGSGENEEDPQPPLFSHLQLPWGFVILFCSSRALVRQNMEITYACLEGAYLLLLSVCFNLSVFFQCFWEILFLQSVWLVSLKLSLDSQECMSCHSSCQFMVFLKHSLQDDMNNTFFQIFSLSWTWPLVFLVLYSVSNLCFSKISEEHRCVFSLEFLIQFTWWSLAWI